ncbi:hypothetical protein RUM43_004408, partial [Polyplax serrata]
MAICWTTSVIREDVSPLQSHFERGCVKDIKRTKDFESFTSSAPGPLRPPYCTSRQPC